LPLRQIIWIAGGGIVLPGDPPPSALAQFLPEVRHPSGDQQRGASHQDGGPDRPNDVIGSAAGLHRRQDGGSNAVRRRRTSECSFCYVLQPASYPVGIGIAAPWPLLMLLLPPSLRRLLRRNPLLLLQVRPCDPPDQHPQHMQTRGAVSGQSREVSELVRQRRPIGRQAQIRVHGDQYFADFGTYTF